MHVSHLYTEEIKGIKDYIYHLTANELHLGQISYLLPISLH